jgi:hypothetical protein
MGDDALDVIAKAVDEAYGSPEVRTAYDTAKHIADALAKAGYVIVRTDNCPHCGAGSAAFCNLDGPCLWTN